VRVSYQPPDPYRPPSPAPAAPVGQYSPDGRWFWDGRQWNPVTIPGPPWAQPYAPPEGRAAAAVALVALASAGVVFSIPGRLLELIAFTTSSVVAAVASSVFLFLADAAFVIGGVGAAVAVPMWMHRAFRNLPALGEQGMRWSPAWAAGGWFIPVANLVIPYQVMRVLWSSFGDLRALPQLWWTALIAAIVLGLVSVPVAAFSLAAATFIGILGSLAIVAAGYTLVTMIRRISRRERDRQLQIQSR
jgi:Domain of unknown function (DUF4328)